MDTTMTATSKERYDKVFMEALNLSAAELGESLIYNSVAAWDSVGHMSLMAALETEFDIMMETDDIIDFSSYVKGMELLAKYGVQF
jgi:acyl carrier protein